MEGHLTLSSAAKSWARVLLVFVLFSVVAASDRATAPAGADADPGVYSALRAFRHVERIARSPRPAGSSESLAVRSWLTAELRALGLEPQVQSLTDGPSELANVLVRIPGTHPGPAVLLATHHDSVPTGPGAADAGACVATLLEAARALRAGPPLKNDIILLFSDGEERGMLGAAAFVAHHPWVRDVRVALNFEARGNSGPVMMFETSERNGWLVRQLANALRRPLATSASVSVYRVLPNDTDFSVFREAGLQGMNFALLYGIAHYHTFRDTPEELDLRSLQDLGDQALSLARHFGSLDLGAMGHEPDAVYVSVLRRWLLRYPGALKWPLTLVALAGFILIVLMPLRDGSRLPARAVLASAGIWVGSSALFVLVLRGAWARFSDLDPHLVQASWRVAVVDDADGACLLMAAVLVAALHLTVRIAARRFGVHAVAAGGLLPWVLLTLTTTLTLSGFHYAFCLPLLLGTSMLALGRLPAATPVRQQLRALGQLVALLLSASLVASMPRHFFAALVIEPAPALLLVALLYGLAVPFLFGSDRVEATLRNGATGNRA